MAPATTAVRRVGRPSFKTKPDIAPELVALHRDNPKGAEGFACYDRLIDKVGTEEGKQGFNIVSGIYGYSEKHNLSILDVCKKYIRDNDLDWSADKFYALVRQMKSRTEGGSQRPKKAAAKKDRLKAVEEEAKKAGKGDEEVKAALKAEQIAIAKEEIERKAISMLSIDDVCTGILAPMFKTQADVYYTISRLQKYVEKLPAIPAAA
jgi:hypothetical protein